MAHIKTTSVMLCALLLTPFTLIATPALASEHTHPPAGQKQRAEKSVQLKSKSSEKNSGNNSTKHKKSSTAAEKTRLKTAKKRAVIKKTASSQTLRKRNASSSPASASPTGSACRKSRKLKNSAACTKLNATASGTIAGAHKLRVQKAQKTAMSRLMQQIGKPYHWGGTSPRTGFDCSGLVWYAYKDLVKFRIPRTANEMYHLRDAAPVKLRELETGDLVFFRTRGRGTADHVGVYVGNGKFIQSPSSGQGIQVTRLSEDYWKRHYVGARRVMTAKNIR